MQVHFLTTVQFPLPQDGPITRENMMQHINHLLDNDVLQNRGGSKYAAYCVMPIKGDVDMRSFEVEITSADRTSKQYFTVVVPLGMVYAPELRWRSGETADQFIYLGNGIYKQEDYFQINNADLIH